LLLTVETLATLGKAMNLKMIDGDLLDQPVEVIVNAWNRNIIPWWLLLPQGVCGAIGHTAHFAPARVSKDAPIDLESMEREMAS
jgi:O-acetyl-ADP-ribose deacetylase (regulator of RNase III)